jgi:alpha-1,6-mannosyltransferase
MTILAGAERRLHQPGKPWLTNAALVLFGLLIIEFCRAGVVEFSHYTFGFSADVFGQLILYLGAIALIERCPTNKWTLGIIFTVAFIARAVCVFHPAFLSTDVYRYVWDGKVQAAGINPFRYIPADSHLSFLRDNAIYPHINRKEYAHTIYPPGAQVIFLAITRFGASEPLMKLGMVGFEAVTCFVLMRILRLVQLPRERVLLYAWNPLCFWEIASSGHVDAAALTFLSLALYACLRMRASQAGAWLGAATLVKMYPLALLPAMLALPFRRREYKIIATTVGVILLGYACYASVGTGVFGFLPEYAQEEGLETGGRYFPLKFINRSLHSALPANLYLGFCGVLMLVICIWAMRRGNRKHAVIFSSLVIATVLNLCFAPHYPWYFLWLLPALTIYPWRPAFYLVSAATFLFSTQLGAPGEPTYLLNKALYGGFFLMLGYDLLLRYAPVRASAKHQPPTYPQRAAMLSEQLADAREL